MVGYAFLLLRGWLEWVGVVRSRARLESRQVRGGGRGLVGVKYGWGVILSS